MIVIDSDNAMGAPFGDVDDGFALAALLRSNLRVGAISSVAGNTSERRADRNNRRIGALCGYQGPFFRGSPRVDVESEASRFLMTTVERMRVVALGPLTNIGAAVGGGAALPIDEIVIVGGNAATSGRWPPLFPHEFNLTRDRKAARMAFDSVYPLTVVPLDILHRLKLSSRELAQLEGAVGDYLRRHSARWIRRSRLVRFSSHFRVCDLVAALYVIDPALFVMEMTTARMRRNTFIEFDRGERPLLLMRDFDASILWQRFLELVNLAGS